MAEKKDLTLEVSAQNASFYSPGGHLDPSHGGRNESQDTPVTGPEKDGGSPPEPSSLGSVCRNQEDRALNTLRNFGTAAMVMTLDERNAEGLPDQQSQ